MYVALVCRARTELAAELTATLQHAAFSRPLLSLAAEFSTHLICRNTKEEEEAAELAASAELAGSLAEGLAKIALAAYGGVQLEQADVVKVADAAFMLR